MGYRGQTDQSGLPHHVHINQPSCADDGKGALDYIVNCFAAGVDKLKLKATDKQYLTYMREGIPSGAKQQRRQWPS